MTSRKGFRLNPACALGAVLKGALGAILVVLISSGISISVSARTLRADLGPPGQGGGPVPGLMLKPHSGGDAPVSALLVGTKIAIDVAGPIARGTVTQIFANPTDQWAEGTYVFPLPEQSATDRFTLRVGDRVIDGTVHEREEAHRLFAEARSSGRRAGLLDQERPNIFTLSVTNIPPSEMVAVAFSFQLPVQYVRDRYELRMPLVVGPRYIPRSGAGLLTVSNPSGANTIYDGIEIGPREAEAEAERDAARADADEDASRITPPYWHPSAGPANPVAIDVKLDPGFALAKLESPSHPVTIDKTGGSYHVALRETVPADRDFILDWVPERGAAPSAAALSDAGNDGTYMLATVMPPQADAATAPPPREVVFVIDISGSMEGTSIGQAKAALLVALDRLKPTDRFNVIAFNDRYTMLFSGPHAADEPSVDAARGFVRALQANGGTEMREPLAKALDGTPPDGYLRQIVFLTDGSVGNEAELFGLISERLKSARLFMVGIGSAPNGYFMTKAAEIGRGTAVMISDVGQVQDRMGALTKKLEAPAMTDLAVTFPDGVKGEMYPSKLPDLYADEPLTFVVRLDHPVASLRVTGQRAGALWAQDVVPVPADHDARMDKLWASKKVDDIMSSAFGPNANAAAVRAAVVDLGLRHQLLTRYTSLLAVERSSARPVDAPLAKGSIPLNLPAGWDYDKVFGPAPQDATPMPSHTNAPDPQAVPESRHATANPAQGPVPGTSPDLATPLAATAPAGAPVSVAAAAAPASAMVVTAASGVALPQGATPAELHLLIALALLAMAGIAAAARRRA